MLFDSLMMATIATELTRLVCGTRIRRIFVVRSLEVALETSAQVPTPIIVISADAQFTRVHLSGQVRPRPDLHSPFTDLLRRYLRAATLRSAEQVDFDRQLHLHFTNCQDLGPDARCTLVIETMGRHSNIVLLDDEGLILGCAKHIASDVNRYRQTLPGLEYVPPPAFEKVDPRDLSAEDFLSQAADADPEMSFAEWFRHQFQGASNLFLAELTTRTDLDKTVTMSNLPVRWNKRLHTALHAMLETAAAEGTGYVSAEAPGLSTLAYPLVPLSRPEPTITEVDTLSAAVETVHAAQYKHHSLSGQCQRLRAAAGKKLAQVTTRRQAREKVVAEAKVAPRYRQFGELILAHLAQIPPRASEITVPDYYADGQPPVTIKLDPDHTPQEMAQYYFDRYKRYRRRQELLPRLIRRDRLEQQYLRGLMHQIESADDLSDLAELGQEMVGADYLRAPRRPPRPAARRKLPRFVTQDGHTVLYGKTGHQNDEVLREADGDDIWLHVKQGPGAHVVIRTGGRPDAVAQSTILQAAQHAAALSKQAQSPAVDINYTLVKHVRKPRGVPPGFVRYTDFQTLRVRPQLATTSSSG